MGFTFEDIDMPDISIIDKLVTVAMDVLDLIKRHSKEEVQNAIDKAKSSGGDTSDLEQLLSR